MVAENRWTTARITFFFAIFSLSYVDALQIPSISDVDGRLAIQDALLPDPVSHSAHTLPQKQEEQQRQHGCTIKQHEPRERSQRGLLASSGERFLIPLLPYGLSNQILALKEAMAVAHILNLTIVTFGFWPHYTEINRWKAAQAIKASQVDRRRLPEVPVIPFDTIFERQSMASVVRVITHEEAVQQYDWPPNGPLDALITFAKSGFDDTLKKAVSAALLDIGQLKVKEHRSFSCSKSDLSWLDDKIRGRRWTALYSYRQIVPDARYSYGDFSSASSPCARAFQKVSRQLVKSRLIADTARAFVDTFFVDDAVQAGVLLSQPPSQRPAGLSNDLVSLDGGRNSSVTGSGVVGRNGYYIAIHIRPYPEECMQYFMKMMTFNEYSAAKVCDNPRVIVDAAKMLRRLFMARAAFVAAQVTVCAGRTDGSDPIAPVHAAPSTPMAIFVMAHPDVRETVRKELQRIWDEKGNPPSSAKKTSTSSSRSKSKKKSKSGSKSKGSRGLGRALLAASLQDVTPDGSQDQLPADVMAAHDADTRGEGSDAPLMPSPTTGAEVNTTGAGIGGDGGGSAPTSPLVPPSVLPILLPASQLASPAPFGASSLVLLTTPQQAPPPPAALPLPPLHFMDVLDLPEHLSSHIMAISLLSMAEQQVCRDANVFIGSRDSSISVMVAQERVAVDPAGAARATREAKGILEGKGFAAPGACDAVNVLDGVTLLV